MISLREGWFDFCHLENKTKQNKTLDPVTRAAHAETRTDSRKENRHVGREVKNVAASPAGGAAGAEVVRGGLRSAKPLTPS